ncbi:indole-3-glycerol phosphate synthase TrpC [Agrilactobacillus yilanensis]|uniref:Indole-3-glycerol phosphate synthase n=1 Tax=Agrilactobacillus yilanensis TaxID=2485997 RepID=A0ABW4J9E1_9LACO|nr:indole-3-glycerol phosphate synthase TrpC [Agrilactobacillus yilanensis]
MILDDLVAATTKRLVTEKSKLSLAALKAEVSQLPITKSTFAKTLQQPGLHIIGELKQASPSKGQIVTDFPYLQIAKEYALAQVTAISVLTEPDYFKGQLTYLEKVHQVTDLPLLRKDFTIDPYMIYQAKISGASIILLIVAILTDAQLHDYLHLAKDLGLDAIVEVHDAQEIRRALAANAKIIGINNRNLKDFSVDLQHSQQLRQLIPATIPVIAESGLKTPTDVKTVYQAGFNGVLIGESLMRAKNKVQLVQQFQAVI